jgi:anti-anti-sigma factor
MISEQAPASFSVSSHQGAESIVIGKELTVVEAVPFRNAFAELVSGVSPPLRVVLDFSQTEFIDSSGIGALVSAIKMSKSAQIAISAAGVKSNVRELLLMTGLDKILPIDKNESMMRDLASAKDSIVELPVTHASVRSTSKRVIDVIGSLIGLVITGVLIVPIAIAMKLEGPGPLFFSQERCGWMGRRFKLYKFRSMVPDAERRKHEIKNEAEGAIFKASNDPRITRVGRFLRRTSLDELPQFWNVLQGSMSLVGTRPPTPDEMNQYDIPDWRRFDVKPGITGEWQVNGRSNIKNFEDIIRLDLRYQRNWSLAYDIKLLVKTITVIFSKDSGAM